MQQYFQQAKQGYDPKDGDNVFNEKFTVPSELLFVEVCKITGIERSYKHLPCFRLIFNERLIESIKENKVFNKNRLGSEVKTMVEQRLALYWVYFAVIIKKNPHTPLPFGKTVKLDGITFQHIQRVQFGRVHRKKCLKSYYQKIDENLRKGKSLNSVRRDLHYFKVKVKANDMRSAADIATGAFNVLCVCATVAQNSKLYSYGVFGLSVSPSSLLTPPSVMLVSSDKHRDCELAWIPDTLIEANEKLVFTTKKTRMKHFLLYKRVCNDGTPIGKRLRWFLFEYANALRAKEPHIRQLGFWRCLELATRKQRKSRPHEEIIQIISNHYVDPLKFWRQQGDIIKDVRNDFVHEGVVLNEDVQGATNVHPNWTKEYADVALDLLKYMRARHIGKKSAEEIDYYFDLYPKPIEMLRLANDLIRGRKNAKSQ